MTFVTNPDLVLMSAGGIPLASGMRDPKGKEEPVHAWCHLVFNNPDGETPEQCVINFMNKNDDLAFTRLSLWGYCNASKCEVLMYYSMWAETPLEANKYMSKFINSPDTLSCFEMEASENDGCENNGCKNDDIASWVKRATTSLSDKGAYGRAPGIPGGLFIHKKEESPQKALTEFEAIAKRGLFVMRW